MRGDKENFIMEFNNQVFIIGVNLRDLHRLPSSQHIFVDVIVIDKSNDILNPLVYQLHSDALSQQDNSSAFYHSNFLKLEDNAFIMIGEVLVIDKTRKMVHLTNQMSVSYKHLIIASGIKNTLHGAAQEEEFSVGVHALWEALRIRNNIKDSMIVPELSLGFSRKKLHSKACHKSGREPPSLKIQALIPPDLNKAHEKSLEMILGGHEKRLYELQLGSS